MRYIQTVNGTAKADKITFCHSHEHLMINKGTSFSVNSNLCIDDYTKSLEELKNFVAAGGTTIVDCQPVGCGRAANALSNLGHDSGVQIIASTGFHKMIFYPEDHWIFNYTARHLSQLFLHEISAGMYIDCDNQEPRKWISAKAGMIKCALDIDGLDQQYGKLFTAAVTAAKQTDVPLMVHIEQGSAPLDLIAYLVRQKIDLNRVIFCHLDRACPDIELHKEICRYGVYLEYDTIGRFKYHDDDREADIFSEMIAAGYEDRLLFSLDTTRERLKSYNPDGVGLTYIMETFIPVLKKHGVTDEQINKFACFNPRRILSYNRKELDTK